MLIPWSGRSPPCVFPGLDVLPRTGQWLCGLPLGRFPPIQSSLCVSGSSTVERGLCVSQSSLSCVTLMWAKVLFPWALAFPCVIKE